MTQKILFHLQDDEAYGARLGSVYLTLSEFNAQADRGVITGRGRSYKFRGGGWSRNHDGEPVGIVNVSRS